ncbi:MAG: type IX secretion system membrane protein PorP/SprF [Prevotellaceae bacterium]|jgi:type IX secretion system PorP/SprF family membrane protein|nr:type IX secretion system membrane protein PorP/SprF [Prevotellaceae bacterium]
MLIVCMAVISVNAATAQSDFGLTQRWFNEMLYNPAAAGNNFSTGIFLHTRQQWVGISGAPSTYAGSLDTYIESLSSGLGLSFAADRLGTISSYNTRFAYAFYIPVGKKFSLSLGLSGGILFRSRKIGDEDAFNNDPASAYGNVSESSPDFDIGFELRGPFKAGLSVRHLAVQSAQNNLQTHTINMWAYASSRFNISESTSLEPIASVLYNNYPQFEGGALLYFMKNERKNVYNDRFWLGALYRTGSSGIFALLAGVQLTPKIRLGYSFDYAAGELATLANAGTHELFLSFYLNRIFYKDEACPAYRNYRR